MGIYDTNKTSSFPCNCEKCQAEAQQKRIKDFRESGSETVPSITEDDLAALNRHLRGVSSSTFDEQVGGDHYKNMPVQPVEYIYKNGIGYIEGCVIKYVSRWRSKGGVEDLRKARHFLDLLIEMETGGTKLP